MGSIMLNQCVGGYITHPVENVERRGLFEILSVFRAQPPTFSTQLFHIPEYLPKSPFGYGELSPLLLLDHSRYWWHHNFDIIAWCLVLGTLLQEVGDPWLRSFSDGWSSRWGLSILIKLQISLPLPYCLYGATNLSSQLQKVTVSAGQVENATSQPRAWSVSAMQQRGDICSYPFSLKRTLNQSLPLALDLD